MSRDPRIDPSPGDVVRKGRRQRTVTLFAREIIHFEPRYLCQNSFRGRPHWEVSSGQSFTELRKWRSWCRGAEVLTPHPDSRAAELTGAD
jgi:hypothetical protein